MTATLTIHEAPVARQEDVGRSRIGRRLAVTGLLLGAAGNTAQAVLSQIIGERPESIDGQVALVQQNPTLVTAMAVVGLVAVPFMVIAFLAAAQELRARARRTATAAGVLLSLGMWGFLGIQFAMLFQVRALLSADGHDAARFLNDLGDNPLIGVIFGAPFVLGCVLGMLTLTIGLLVKGGVPRWIPAAWLVFILLDFSIGRVGPVDPHWLWFAGACGLAVHLLRRDGRVRAGA